MAKKKQTKSSEESDKMKSLKSLLKSKDSQLKSKDRTIRAKDREIASKTAELLAKDRENEILKAKLKRFESFEDHMEISEEQSISQIESWISNQGLEHIPEKIFQCLDAKSLAKCRQVSQSWKTFIDTNRPLLYLQINHFKNYGKVEMDFMTQQKEFKSFIGKFQTQERLEWEALFTWIKTFKCSVSYLTAFFKCLRLQSRSTDCAKIFCGNFRVIQGLEFLFDRFGLTEKNLDEFAMRNYVSPNALESILKYVKLQGIDINKRHFLGSHITHRIYGNRRFAKEMLEILMKNAENLSIDFNAENTYKKTVLQLAQENGDTAIVELFKKYEKVLHV